MSLLSNYILYTGSQKELIMPIFALRVEFLRDTGCGHCMQQRFLTTLYLLYRAL